MTNLWRFRGATNIEHEGSVKEFTDEEIGNMDMDALGYAFVDNWFSDKWETISEPPEMKEEEEQQPATESEQQQQYLRCGVLERCLESRPAPVQSVQSTYNPTWSRLIVDFLFVCFFSPQFWKGLHFPPF